MPEQKHKQEGGKKGARSFDPARFAPFATMLVLSMLVGIASGYGAWRLFGSNAPAVADKPQPPVETSERLPGPVPTVEQTPTPEPTPTPTPAATPLPGVVEVEGGEVILGGGETGLPLRRVYVEPFAIAETEVTNEQYRQFVTATNRRAPARWQGQDFPEGEGQMPVINVSWHDAVAFCQWLSKQTGQTVALPTEAEWERAARGPNGFKYPWGDEWDESAAAYKSKVGPVKRFPAGRSHYGAYDMVGNVWEWVADLGSDERGRTRSPNGADLRVIKGGSAEEEDTQFLTALSRYARAVNMPRHTIGFRYVVRPKTEAPPAPPQQ